MKVRFSH